MNQLGKSHILMHARNETSLKISPVKDTDIDTFIQSIVFATSTETR